LGIVALGTLSSWEASVTKLEHKACGKAHRGVRGDSQGLLVTQAYDPN